jgi:hypothetical protein
MAVNLVSTALVRRSVNSKLSTTKTNLQVSMPEAASILPQSKTWWFRKSAEEHLKLGKSTDVRYPEVVSAVLKKTSDRWRKGLYH